MEKEHLFVSHLSIYLLVSPWLLHLRREHPVQPPVVEGSAEDVLLDPPERGSRLLPVLLGPARPGPDVDAPVQALEPLVRQREGVPPPRVRVVQAQPGAAVVAVPAHKTESMNGKYERKPLLSLSLSSSPISSP